MWSTIESDIGTVGSESSTIIVDIEYSEGARISLEKDTPSAPFAITLGLYGLMMHTIRCGSESESMQIIVLLKSLIEEVIQAYQSDDRDRAYLLIDKIEEF